MKKLAGRLLVIVGTLVILIGAYLALSAFSGLYESNLSDPLNQPEGAEKKIAESMMRGVYVGSPGIALLIVGKVLLASARRTRR